jgi:hypothetical protein
MPEKHAAAWRYKRGRFERAQPRIMSKLAHPVWDADLNSIEVLKRFRSAKELRWGMVLRVLGPGWEPLEEVRIFGQDWILQFFPPGTIRVPIVRGPLGRSKPQLTSFRQPAALLQIPTEKGDLNRSRDYGAKLLRSLVGLLQTQYNLVVANQPLWEGAIGVSNEGRPSFMASGQEAAVPGLTPQRLHRSGLELAPFRLADLPRHLASSLRWYGLAWSSADDRTAQFMHFWLAAVVLVDHGYTRSQLSAHSQNDRIDRYIAGMVLSTTRSQGLSDDLKASYDIRNEIVHECRDDSVTLVSLERLQEAALELIEFEKGQFLAGIRQGAPPTAGPTSP